MRSRSGISIQTLGYLIEAIMSKKWGLSDISSDERGKEEAWKIPILETERGETDPIPKARHGVINKPMFMAVKFRHKWQQNSGVHTWEKMKRQAGNQNGKANNIMRQHPKNTKTNTQMQTWSYPESSWNIRQQWPRTAGKKAVQVTDTNGCLWERPRLILGNFSQSASPKRLSAAQELNVCCVKAISVITQTHMLIWVVPKATNDSRLIAHTINTQTRNHI